MHFKELKNNTTNLIESSKKDLSELSQWSKIKFKETKVKTTKTARDVKNELTNILLEPK